MTSPRNSVFRPKAPALHDNQSSLSLRDRAVITRGQRLLRYVSICVAVTVVAGCAVEVPAQDATSTNPDSSKSQNAGAASNGSNSAAAEKSAEQGPLASIPADVLIDGEKLIDYVKISPKDSVWLGKKSKTVVVAGSVCSREGPLEMFACPRGTKDYESVVAVDSRAQIVHSALLAAGVRSGTPVEFTPVYKAATGPIIVITVVWKDPATGKWTRKKAQDWVRSAKTGNAMSADWVFAGSGFWKDPDTGKEFYLAEGGELVCVSNFATATLDLPVSSPQANDDLFFEAFKERIPPLDTRVWLLFDAKTEGNPDSSRLQRR